MSKPNAKRRARRERKSRREALRRREAAGKYRARHQVPHRAFAQDELLSLGYWLIGFLEDDNADRWKATLQMHHPDPNELGKEIQWWIGAGLCCREYVERNPEVALRDCFECAKLAGLGDSPDTELTAKMRVVHRDIQLSQSRALRYLKKWYDKSKEGQDV